MKKLTKKDTLKLKWLADRGIETEAFLLSSEIQDLPEKLGNSYPFFPSWSYLMQVSGQLEELARHLQFANTLDKPVKKK